MACRRGGLGGLEPLPFCPRKKKVPFFKWKKITVTTRLNAWAFIYLEHTFAPALIRGRRLFEV